MKLCNCVSKIIILADETELANSLIKVCKNAIIV